MLNLTSFLKFYARNRNKKLFQKNYSYQQEQQLFKLIAKAKDTTFGKQYNFNKIKSVNDYQQQVPLRTYEQFWAEYWKPNFPKLTNCTWPGEIPYFAVSSGTSSGTTKYIPLTKALLKSNEKAGLDLLTWHINNKPNSKILAGKSFFLGGSTALVKLADNIYSGDLSGISIKDLPWWARLRLFPDQKLALLSNWEEKIEKFIDAIKPNEISALNGVPSWLLIFLDQYYKRFNFKSIQAAFPNLEMLVHGGVSFAPYFDNFNQLFKNSLVDFREVYPASEAFIAVADRAYDQGLRIILDHAIFYEFVPVDELDSKSPTRHWIKNVETDVNYAIVLTTCAGLWSYILGDTIKFTELDPPRLKVTGRTSYMLSAFGEHLILEEIESAVVFAAKQLNLEIGEYAVGPLFPNSTSELGGHIYVIEFYKMPSKDNIDQFTKLLDQKLSALNEDYDAHRAKGFGLNAPKVLPVLKGTLINWMKSRGKLGGQNKVPRIINKPELLNGMLHFVDKSFRI